jgi:hypothetical protein
VHVATSGEEAMDFLKPVDFEQFGKVIKELELYWMIVNSLPA